MAQEFFFPEISGPVEIPFVSRMFEVTLKMTSKKSFSPREPAHRDKLEYNFRRFSLSARPSPAGIRAPGPRLPGGLRPPRGNGFARLNALAAVPSAALPQAPGIFRHIAELGVCDGAFPQGGWGRPQASAAAFRRAESADGHSFRGGAALLPRLPFLPSGLP